jgi:hypothetical protein
MMKGLELAGRKRRSWVSQKNNERSRVEEKAFEGKADSKLRTKRRPERRGIKDVEGNLP